MDNDVVVEKIEVIEKKETPKKQVKTTFNQDNKEGVKVKGENVIKNKSLIDNIKKGKDIKPSDVKVQLISLKSKTSVEGYFKKIKSENKK
jgi:hypothetical protein